MKIETFPRRNVEKNSKKYLSKLVYRLKKKKCLGKLCFKEQVQDDSYLDEFIITLLSHISQRDSLILVNLIVC